MIDYLKRIRKEMMMANWSGVAEGSHKNPVRIASVPVEIQTEHLMNTSLVIYHYTTCSMSSAA
jgi:hypothetical protein